MLLGEASHGTSEFYRARAAITRRLIEKHGFSYRRGRGRLARRRSPSTATCAICRRGPARAPAFRRFPTWMWRNTDVEAFVEWLRGHNEQQPADRRAGFFGLDIYSLADSIAAVLAYLDKVDPAAAKVARERYGCLTPWQHDPAVYGRAVLSERYRACEADMVATLRDLLAKRLEYAAHDGEQFFDAAQNARLVAAAERYYRAMYYGGAESWNLRDHAHVRDAAAPAGRIAAERQGGGVGAQLPYRRRPLHRHGPSCASELNSASCAASRFGEQGGADRLRHPRRHRRGGVRLGLRRWR